MDPEPVNKEESVVQPRPSSWSAALSQLPGFPREEKPPVPLPSETARTVTPMKSADD